MERNARAHDSDVCSRMSFDIRPFGVRIATIWIMVYRIGHLGVP